MYMLLEDYEHGAEVYSGATSEKQAGEIFKPARMMVQRSQWLLDDYGIEVGKSADLVVIDNVDQESAVAELSPPLMGFKRGRMTFRREPAELLWPS